MLQLDKLNTQKLCIEMRNLYGLSQSDISKVFGFGINTWRNYENGDKPSLSNLTIICLATDPDTFKKLFEDYRKIYPRAMSQVEEKKILDKINKVLKKIEEELIKFKFNQIVKIYKLE